MNEIVPENENLLMNLEMMSDFPMELESSKFQKLPLGDLATLGVAYQPILQAVDGIINGSSAGTGIYKVSVPEGCHLASFKDKKGFLGTTLNASNGLEGQAVITKMPFDPTMLAVAASIYMVEKKLDNIEETQKDIFQFLKTKEEARHEGNLKILNGIVKDYRFLWKEEQYKSLNLNKVNDILQDAEQGIIFYKKQISKQLKQPELIHWDVAVKTSELNVRYNLKMYQLALYEYSYASFLKLMLIGNFETDYLKHVENQINDASYEYKSIYTECYLRLEKDANTSVESVLLDGIADAGKATGKVLNEIPVLKDRSADFIKSSEKIRRIGDQKTEMSLRELIKRQDSGVYEFVEEIEKINHMYNDTPEIYFDEKQFYIAM